MWLSHLVIPFPAMKEGILFVQKGTYAHTLTHHFSTDTTGELLTLVSVKILTYRNSNTELLWLYEKCYLPLLKVKVYWHLWFHEESLTSMEPFHSTKGSLYWKKVSYIFKMLFSLFTEWFFGESKIALLCDHCKNPSFGKVNITGGELHFFSVTLLSSLLILCNRRDFCICVLGKFWCMMHR